MLRLTWAPACHAPSLFREEDFYLSPSTDGPVMYINMEVRVGLSVGHGA